MRYRAVESLEADGDALKLRGIAVRYGSIARPPAVPVAERFEANAFGNVANLDVVLNVQHRRDRAIARTHGGGLTLIDGPDALRFEAVLPPTREAEDVVRLVRDRVLRGASIEFAVPANGERAVGGVLSIAKAYLSGLGIVDRPAYQDSLIEARAEIRQDGNGLTASYAYGQQKTIAASGSLRKEEVLSGALGFALDNPAYEVNVVLGRDYSSIIGSKLAGSARFTDTPDTLFIDIPTLPATQAVADFRAQLAIGSIAPSVDLLYSTDGIPDAFEDVPEVGNESVMIRRVNQAVLQAVAIVSRQPRGLDDNEVELRAMKRRLLQCL